MVMLRFESNWTPSTFIEGFEVMFIPFNVIVMLAWSFLWNRHSSVLFSLILSPESFSHCVIEVSFISNYVIKSVRFELDARGKLSLLQ